MLKLSSYYSIHDRIKTFLLFFIACFKPDFWPKSEKEKAAAASQPTRPNKIAYLDGLRGFSSLIVYLSHHAGYAHVDKWPFQRAWGWRDEYYFSCFPGVRLFFNGGSYSVAVFFVLSGYVLARSSLRQLHARETANIANHLGLSLPKRLIRLYFPVLCTTFCFMTSWHILGIEASSNAIPKPKKTYWKELKVFTHNFVHQLFIYDKSSSGLPPYNPQLWNIPRQFKSSFIVYVILLCMVPFAQAPAHVRHLSLIGAMVYFLYVVNGWYCAMVIMGILICDIDLLSEKNKLPPFFHKLKVLTLRGWIWYPAIIIALYLSGAPRVSDAKKIMEKDPGWYLLASLTPQAVTNSKWFFEFWAATLSFLAIPRIPWMKAMFEKPGFLYLGKISFGMYLVHGPVLWTFGDRIYSAVGLTREFSIKYVPGWIDLFPLPAGPFGFEISYWAAQCILLPLTMYLAGVVNKLFDEPSAQLGKWIFDPSRFQDNHEYALLG